MLLGFVSFVLAGAFRAALLSCRALWALGVQSLVGNVLWWAVWPAMCPLRAAKRAAQLSRPSWVVFALPPVSGGSGTVEGLNFRLRQPPSSFEGCWGTFLPFWYLRASLTIFTTALAGGVVSAAKGSAVGRLNGGAKAAVELLRRLGYHDVAEFLGVLVV